MKDRSTVLTALTLFILACFVFATCASSTFYYKSLPATPNTHFMLIDARLDRYGTNALLWIWGVAIAKRDAYTPVHICCSRCRRGKFIGTAFHDALVALAFTEYSMDKTVIFNTDASPYIAKLHEKFRHRHENPLQTILNTGMHVHFHDHLHKRCSAIKDLYTEKQPYSVIHQRLEDVSKADVRRRNQAPYPSSIVNRLLIKTDDLLVRKCHSPRRAKNVLVTDPKSRSTLEDSMKFIDAHKTCRYPVEVAVPADQDETLLYMVDSAVLVCGRSNFSLCAAVCRFGRHDLLRQNIEDTTWQGSSEYSFIHGEDLCGRGRLSSVCDQEAYGARLLRPLV
uniref:Uncharacterized protein n=1 Tax=viral metagenome TaxID=1070528 RepID=A0A6C0BZP9_9ZZZZ